MGISTCRLIVLPSILYHVSLNSRACFVCARPNSSVSVQLNVKELYWSLTTIFTIIILTNNWAKIHKFKITTTK